MGKESSTTANVDADTGDRKLVEATLAGNSEALSVLHHRYYQRIYRLALVRCASAQDAEDVAAETFVRAITHLSSYRFQGESLFPWLARIATNLAADQRRRNRGATFVSLSGNYAIDAVCALVDALPAHTPDPHAAAEQHEVRALVRAAIDALPPDQASAILLRFLGDLSLKDIAMELGRTEGAIKSLLHRALVNLRVTLSSSEAGASVFGQTKIAARSAAVATPSAARRGLAGGRAAPAAANQEPELIWERSDTR